MSLLVAFAFAAAQAPVLLTNQLGYEKEGPKRAVVQGHAGDELGACAIKDDAGETALVVEPRPLGGVPDWRDWSYWTVDFSALKKEGVFHVSCSVSRRDVSSFPFRVQEGVLLRHTLSDVLFYFKGQRATGLLDEADHSLPFEGRGEGRWDAHGGWYDATGDYGKHLSHLSFSAYFNPQQIPLAVWALLKSAELLSRRGEGSSREYLRRLMDEGAWGADFLVRLKATEGSFYRSVAAPGPGKRPEDRRIERDPSAYSIKTSKDEERPREAPLRSDELSYQSSLRSGAGVAIAALARAAAMGAPGERRGDYLTAAEAAWAFLKAHNQDLTSDGRENALDDYCALLAATELYRATSKTEYLWAADQRADALTARLTREGGFTFWRADDKDRPFFHASDAGLPVASLLAYADVASEDRRKKVLSVVRASLEGEIAITQAVPNPFGYARQVVRGPGGQLEARFFFPHDSAAAPWWQGENARLASLAYAARAAMPFFPREPAFLSSLSSYAQDQLNWILGLNPFDASMLQGQGRNNPEYLFFDSYEYTNAPGGICNGITSGFKDDRGIDFALPHTVTGGDHDWRWEEQWLPHASWYLLAVAVGDRAVATTQEVR